MRQTGQSNHKMSQLALRALFDIFFKSVFGYVLDENSDTHAISKYSCSTDKEGEAP